MRGLPIAAFLLSAALLSSCDNPSRTDEVNRNSEDPSTGVMATVAGCMVYRIRNHGGGPSYVFFTKCPDGDVSTGWSDSQTIGKSTKSEWHTNTTVEERR